jgi:hypothetical protein
LEFYTFCKLKVKLLLLLLLLFKKDEMGWYVARMGEKRNVYRTLVVKPEGKRPLGRPRRRRVNNIKMDLRERMAWIGLD